MSTTMASESGARHKRGGSPTKVLEAAILRADRLNPQLNAIVMPATRRFGVTAGGSPKWLDPRREPMVPFGS